MEGKEKILDEFGKLVISKLYDPSINNLVSLKSKENPPELFKDYVELFQKMDEDEFQTLKKYIHLTTSNSIFNFLKILEEDSRFKIYYKNGSELVDLNEISEMLKAEQYGEQGWIAKFSVHKDI